MAEVNDFVTTYMNKRNDFKREHKNMPCLGMCNIFFFFFFFQPIFYFDLMNFISYVIVIA